MPFTVNGNLWSEPYNITVTVNGNKFTSKEIVKSKISKLRNISFEGPLGSKPFTWIKLDMTKIYKYDIVGSIIMSIYTELTSDSPMNMSYKNFLTQIINYTPINEFKTYYLYNNYIQHTLNFIINKINWIQMGSTSSNMDITYYQINSINSTVLQETGVNISEGIIKNLNIKKICLLIDMISNYNFYINNDFYTSSIIQPQTAYIDIESIINNISNGKVAVNQLTKLTINNFFPHNEEDYGISKFSQFILNELITENYSGIDTLNYIWISSYNFKNIQGVNELLMKKYSTYANTYINNKQIPITPLLTSSNYYNSDPWGLSTKPSPTIKPTIKPSINISISETIASIIAEFVVYIISKEICDKVLVEGEEELAEVTAEAAAEEAVAVGVAAAQLGLDPVSDAIAVAAGIFGAAQIAHATYEIVESIDKLKS